MSKEPRNSTSSVSRLRRDLGTLESYATIIGILIGAGIFQVTSRAWAETGPSVILGYIVLTPAILATSIPYAAYLSTPLGREPGGEYLNISRTLKGFRLAYVGSWLKIISYIGAGAYLADAIAGYIIKMSGGRIDNDTFRLPLGLAALVVFFLIHVIGIRWFGRMQVALSALKILALLVLIVPGLFFLDWGNYEPFFTRGGGGFALSLLPLFFAYAGFESITQTAGEVKDSTRRLPKILLKGITVTALIYVFASIVSFGVVPGAALGDAPMVKVASEYLPTGAALFVSIGAIAASMTALNGTILVPSRLGVMFVEDRLAPRWLGMINPTTSVPIRGLTLTLICCAVLLISGQLSLALNVAVFALVVLYFIHSLVFLLLPRLNPTLSSEIDINLSRRMQQVAGVVSVLSMGFLIVVQLIKDAGVLQTLTLSQRFAQDKLTSIELILVWGLVGLGLYQLARSQRRNQPVAELDVHGD
ncbi:MAG TPA: APC family permease [Pyrinomonadaceae bacterium]|nr:APC family permease [Pyrinomonadaceae bacterium]